jgi:polyphosphate kinase
MRKKFSKLIDSEIKNAKQGKPAYIILKLYSLVDQKMIRKLYHASKAGVPVKLIVRAICSLVPGRPVLSENIEAVSLVDRYLEHSRMFVFANGDDEKYYLSSADWMQRNLDHRVEVAWPIYDPDIQQELRAFLDIQWSDNVKARLLNTPDNRYKPGPGGSVRAQVDIYHFLNSKAFS